MFFIIDCTHTSTYGVGLRKTQVKKTSKYVVFNGLSLKSCKILSKDYGMNKI